ncbi:hypothetical protein Tco_0416094, partial [Tanacetum coccineum]
MVRDFPEVFLDDLSRLPPVWQIEFRIELIPEATPILVLRNENSICLLFDLQSKEEDKFSHRTHLKSAFHQGLKFVTPRLSSRAKDDIIYIHLNQYDILLIFLNK